jgi:hypothetical protein
LDQRAEGAISPAEISVVQHKQSQQYTIHVHSPSALGVTWNCVGNSSSSVRLPFGRMRVTKMNFRESDPLEIPE